MGIDKQIFEVLERKLPENAVQYCWDIWKEDPFNLIIAKSRMSKLGDFRYRKDRKIQTITLNHDLNPYQFLITFIHEVAHYRTYKKFGTATKPHGSTWKQSFRELMDPMLSELIFPRDVLLPLRRHMHNPKASSGADLFLSKEVNKYNSKSNDKPLIYLSDLKIGAEFILKGRRFKKEAVRRTRVLCLEETTGRKYLISSCAEVGIQGE